MKRAIKDHLYFIENTARAQMKIGRSADVQKRLAALETTCGHPLTLRAIAHGAGRFEVDVHAALHHDRGMGEWFVHSTDLQELISAPSTIRQWLADRKVQVKSGRLAYRAIRVERSCNLTKTRDTNARAKQVSAALAALASTDLDVELEVAKRSSHVWATLTEWERRARVPHGHPLEFWRLGEAAIRVCMSEQHLLASRCPRIKLGSRILYDPVETVLWARQQANLQSQ